MNTILLMALVGAGQPDAWVTMKTKLALFTASGIDSKNISVDTVDGTVTLYGKVANENEKKLAETETSKIEGARHIRDLLQVVPETMRKEVNTSDDAIKESVARALKADPSLTSSHIVVQSVDGGVVLLSGSAASLSDHLRAVETAHAIAGVRQVKSEIRSPNKIADREIWRDRGTDTTESLTDSANDVWLTSQAKMRLLADAKVPALDVNVDTDRGVITLFGMVNSREAVEAALADAHAIKGAQEIRNELQVVADANQEMVKVRDADLRKAVRSAIRGEDDLKHVNVSVKNGVARLTGSVPSAWQRIHAATLIRATTGVRSVEDDLQIKD